MRLGKRLLTATCCCVAWRGWHIPSSGGKVRDGDANAYLACVVLSGGPDRQSLCSFDVRGKLAELLVR